MKPKVACIAAVLLAFSSGAGAQAMKPGLWEINSKIQMGTETDKEMAQMQQQMASMPPEQRKMMQDMMAKQGMSIGAGGPGTMNVRMCMTKEMVERDHIPDARSDCKNSVSPRAGNTMKFSFSCTNPPSSGVGQTTFLSPEHYTTRMTLDAVSQGKPEKTTMEGSGKWLSSDCGAVKPPPSMKK